MYSDTAVSASVCHTHTHRVCLSCKAKHDKLTCIAYGACHDKLNRTDNSKREVSRPQYDSCQLPDMQKQVTGFDNGKDGACYTMLDSMSRERLSL